MKQILRSTIAITLLFSFTNCATVFHGEVTDYQKTKPAVGQPEREIKVGALIADILLFLPSVIVDFATGAIYKSEAEMKK